jgi:EF-P beta-lysylation protein EpmB
MPVAPQNSTSNPSRWQQELADAVRDPAELLQLLGLDQTLLPAAREAAQQFPLRVPRGFVARMRHGDPHDPLLRQVLPLADELRSSAGYLTDPVGDLQAMQPGGVLHKYHGRVLLVATGACAIHCRYCFRRHFPYAEANAAAGGFAAALDYIRARPEISEVILSGGDPLVLNDRRLAELAHALADIPHLQRLRIHSRLPVVLPSRIDTNLLDWFAGTRLKPVLVLHANHPQELDDEVAAATDRLRARGVLLLNQAVLLAGINDSVEALVALSERLFTLGVQPYYLHALDKVEGAGHFNSDAALQALMPALRARLPGYLVPQAVREEAGQPSKTPLPY